jgi:hypothetical protein
MNASALAPQVLRGENRRLVPQMHLDAGIAAKFRRASYSIGNGSCPTKHDRPRYRLIEKFGNVHSGWQGTECNSIN